MTVLNKLFGHIEWTPPEWGQRIGRRRFFIGTGTLLIIAALLTGGIYYYQSLPRPAMVKVRVQAPGVTPVVDDQLRPQPVILHFSVEADPRAPVLTVDSVARLDAIGKVVDQGVSIEPEIKGEWRWADENTLTFVPATDWPAGQRYTVHYDESLFAPNLILATKQARFRTVEFGVKISELVFYQNPVQKDDRRVVATLSFTHPVDPKSLEEHLSYSMRESGQTINDKARELQFDVRYSPTARMAYVNSEQIEIPPQENYLTLTVGEGLAPVAGPSRLAKTLYQNVRIPDVGTYFRVRNAQAIIARNEDDEPVQTLMVGFTDRVRTDRLQERISAWLLPENVLVDGVPQANRPWQSPREVTADVLQASKKIDLTLSPVDDDSSAQHSAVIDVPENRVIYLKIGEGLTSDGGFVLGRAFDTLVYAPPYPQEVKMARSGAVLPLTGSHRLAFVSRGVSTLRVELGRLLEDDLNHLATQTGGDLASPWFSNYQFNEDNISERTTRFIELNAQRPGKPVFSSLDLSPYLPKGGYYFVNVQGWDKENDRPIGAGDRRFVLITDIGLLVKANADSTQDIFVHSIASGRPIAGARITLLGKNGIPLFEAVSSADGHAGMPATNGFEREQTPAVFVAHNGNDAVFMPYGRHGRMLQYSRFDVGGQYVQHRPDDERLRGLVFTDRGIYRPGDSVDIASIVKRDDWGPLGDIPLKLRIVDPRGQAVLDRTLRLPDDGFLEERFATEVASATGNYNVTLLLGGDDDRWRTIGSAAFKVEEFLPDRLRIRSRIAGQKPAGWLKPGALSCEVDIENLFGTAAQQRRVTGTMDLSPSGVRFAAFPGFVFDDPLREPGVTLQPIHEQLADTNTDDDGHATLPLNLTRYARGIYRLTVSTEGFEEGGGRSVKSMAAVTVSPLDYMIGHKADGNLGFIDKGAVRNVEFLAVNSDGETIALDGLTLSVARYGYVSALVQRPNGTYAYQSVRRETPVSSEQYAVASGGTRYALPTAEPGTYSVILRNAAGLTFSRVDFTVAGAGNLTADLERNAELAIKVKGDSFSPGNDVEIEITAPYAGAGLITIERDRVYAHKWFRSDTTTSVQHIRVPAGIEGNAYINVALVRDIGSPEIYVSPLSYAVAPFSIDRDARTVKIELGAPELVRPGEKLTISHRTSRPSRIVIYAVDEGILQVARYQTPDPLAFFLPKMALQVSTYQMADLILPEFEAYRQAAAPGGGEAAALAGGNLNPFRRKTEAPVAFWSGIIDSGPEERTVAVDVPDYFNGRLRIMAVAVADDAVGSEERQAIVRAPFVITPNVLTAAAPGDEFDVNVGISNNLEGSGEGLDIALSAESSEQLEIVGGNTASLAIDEGSESRARFRVRALDRLGSASLTFRASAGDESSHMSATLSVRPPVAYVATMQSGNGDDDPLSLDFSRRLYDQFARQKAAASASPLILADGMLDYLDAFPHACAEQIVSKVFPQIGFLGDGDAEVDETAVRAQFDETIGKLRSRQNPDGSFRFWATSTEPAPFPSVYIVHFMTDAKELGLAVPHDMLDAGLGYLRTVAANEVRNLHDARLRAYAIYVLTRNGTVTTNYLTNLHEFLEREFKDDWRSDLTASYMAASYVLMQEQRLGDDLIRGYEYGGGDEMTTDFDTRLGRDAQHLYLLARHFPDRMAHVDAETIEHLAGPVMQNRFNTLSSAYTILALGAYTRAAVRNGDAPKLAIAAGNDDTFHEVAASARFARAKIDNALRTVRVTGGGGSDIYYVLSQTGFDRAPPQDALAEGLEIYREYLTDDGTAVTSANIGDELTVRLRVRSTGRPRTNVAVVDLLPGGFEVQTDSIRRQYGGWRGDYTDVREDRVVIYGSFTDRVTELSYRVKLTSSGSFVTPSAFAGSMYDRSIQARTKPGRFEVRPVP